MLSKFGEYGSNSPNISPIYWAEWILFWYHFHIPTSYNNIRIILASHMRMLLYISKKCEHLRITISIWLSKVNAKE